MGAFVTILGSSAAVMGGITVSWALGGALRKGAGEGTRHRLLARIPQDGQAPDGEGDRATGRGAQVLRTLPALHLSRAVPVSLRRRVAEDLARAGLTDCAETVFSWYLIIATSVLLVCSAFGWPLAGCVAVCLPPVAVRTHGARRLQKRRAALRGQLIGYAEHLADGLGSGRTLGQVLVDAAASTEWPLRSVARATADAIGRGVPADNAFVEAGRRAEVAELAALGSALKIQYRAGGDLKQVLHEFSERLRQSALFEQSLATQTAQGRLSVKVVGFVPPLVVVAMNFLMPGYLMTFFSSQLGRTLFVAALAADGFGLVWVRRIMRIDEA